MVIRSRVTPLKGRAETYPIQRADKTLVPPDGWNATRLGEVGYFLKGSNVKRDDALSGQLACVRYGEIYTTHHDQIRSFHSWISPEVAATATRLRFGDLLFAGSGETKEEIGKCVAFVQDIEAYAGGDIVILRPTGVDSLFLGYALNAPEVARQKASLGQGDAVVHISPSALAQVSVRLPRVREQTAIAEALVDVDGLLAALDALIAKRRAIKQAAMQQLLTGKTRLQGFSGEWADMPLGELAKVTMGQSPSSGFYNFAGDGLPLIQGNADLEDRRSIARVWTTQASKRCDAGDLLLTVRAPVGAVGIATTDACLGRGVCGLKPFGNYSFLLQALLFAESRWKSLEQGSTFTAANARQIGRFTLSMPQDWEEQSAIAAVLADMDAEIAALETRLEKTRAVRQGMMQQLLTGRVRLVKPAPAEA
jgi:type I restriction enzyme S subunit